MTADSPAVLRVGSVSFLNARPLVRFLDLAGDPQIKLISDVPSCLARLMTEGLLDVALLPSIEFFRARDYRILSHTCISSDGPVESVRIFSKTPLDAMRSLALDVSSRTSAALAQILLKRKYGTLPALTTCTPDTDLWQIEEDAMLLIGDPAMKFTDHGTYNVLDLGEEWKRQTDLPFVYALWVARAGIGLADLEGRLVKARDTGLANIATISSEASVEIGLDETLCLNYLGKTIRYHLGRRELEGLSLFQQYAAEDGLCPGDAKIAIDNC